MPSFSLNPLSVTDGAAILSLADCKAHLRTGDDSSEDALIEALRDAAIDMVEKFTMKRLSPILTEWQGNSFSDAARSMGVGPVTAITSVKYLDAVALEKTVAAGVYRIANRRGVVLKPGQSWPSDVTSDIDCAVTITFTAGYDPVAVGGSTVPAALIAAVKLMLGHLFLNREAVVTGAITEQLPMGFAELCRLYRDPVI